MRYILLVVTCGKNNWNNENLCKHRYRERIRDRRKTTIIRYIVVHEIDIACKEKGYLTEIKFCIIVYYLEQVFTVIYSVYTCKQANKQ